MIIATGEPARRAQLIGGAQVAVSVAMHALRWSGMTCVIDPGTTIESALEWLQVMERCDADCAADPPRRSGGHRVGPARTVTAARRLVATRPCG